MPSIAHSIHAFAPIGAVVELPSAGTWLENPYVYDAAARDIKAFVAHGCTEIVDEKVEHLGGEPITVHLAFRRLC
ncbi:MAG: hypothetical protein MUC32_07670 [Burkholderiaceae bacterium]|jgi:hypothetical protein|nr:hypothetical protein [Burkholderiaceae bacterium]